MRLRSMLFAPADDARKLAGLARSAADVVVADLEDAVAPSRKQAGRDTLREFIKDLPSSCPPLWVRIGSSDLEAASADFEAISDPRVAGLVVPKVENVEELDRLCRAFRLDDRLQHALVMPQIETALGILSAEQTRAWPESVVTLSFGSVDFARDTGIAFDPQHPLIDHARHRLAVAARGLGLRAPVDGPWMRIQDLAGLVQDAVNGRSLGLSGKSAIHPGQVDIINHEFSELTDERRGFLQRVVDTYESAPDSAALVVDGEFVDEPVYRAALAELSGR